MTAPVRGAEDPEQKLDLPLKLVYRDQAGRAEGQGLARRGGAVDVVRRLRGLASGERSTGSGAEGLLSVLVRYEGPRAALRSAGFRVESCLGVICTGTLRASRLGALVGLQGVRSVQSAQRMTAAGGPGGGPAQALLSRGRAAPPDAGGTGALVAFVDTGVDVRHHDFRKADGTTRIKYLLDFSDPGDVNGDGRLEGSGPYGGTLYTEAAINAALAGGAAIGERDTTGHGTHGLSIAAGDETPWGVAPGADLIVVKATREDGSLGFVSTDVVNALSFVDEKARELGRPLVVNLSLGTIVGAHDGRSLEEQAIDQMTGPGIPGRVAVIAAGNSSDNRAARYRHFHDRALVGLSRTHTLTVPVYTANPGQGDDRILLDVWYPGRDKLTVRLTSPGGTTVSAAYGQYVDEETAEGNVFIANLGGASLENGDVEAMVLIDDWAGVVPASGTWTVTFEGEEIGDTGEYHGWLSDDSAVGAAAPWLSANADNLFLVGKPGTSFNGVTVGSYAWHDPGSRYRVSWVDVHGIGRVDTTAVVGQISDFSSPGGTRDGRLKPDVVAPGERVLGAVSADAWPGVSATSIYRYHGFPEPDALLTSSVPDRAYGLLQGTSFSAPVVTGLAARILSTSPTLDAVQVRNVLVNSANADAFTGPVPNETWGWGKVGLDLGGGPGPLPANLRIDTYELPLALVDEAFQVVLMASGGRMPYTWSLAGGLLPPGLALDSHGLVSGRPLSAGSFDFIAGVTDSSVPPQVVRSALALQVSTVAPLQVPSNALPVAELGKPYDEAVEATGGTPPYAWTLEGGALPPGLALRSDGRLQGSASALGRFAFTLKVVDSTSAIAYGSLRLRVTLAGAQAWDPLGMSLTEVRQVAVDPNEVAHVLVSTWGVVDPTKQAVFESTDAGESWRSISDNNGFATGYADWLGVNPAGSVPWASSQGPAYKYDPVLGWKSGNLCVSSGASVLDFDDAGGLYVIADRFCDAGPTFRRTTDQGATWQALSTPCGVSVTYGGQTNYLSVFRADPRYVYLTRSSPSTNLVSVTCASRDGGTTWTEVGRLDASFKDYVDVQVSQANPLDVVRGIVEIATGVPLLSVERSLDGGTTWTRYPVAWTGSSDTSAMVRAASDPAVLLLGTKGQTGGRLYRSLDHGQTWTVLPVKGRTTLDVTSIAIDPTSAGRFYVGTTEGLFHTTDGGHTWALQVRGLVRRGLTGLAVSAQAPNEMLLTTNEGPYVSRTGGQKWTLSHTGFPSWSTGETQAPVVSAADPSLYFAIDYADQLYRSTTRGVTWTPVQLQIATVAADPFDANVALAGAWWWRGPDGVIFRSTDKGTTWGEVPFTEGEVEWLVFARDVRNRAYMGTNGLGVYRSDDGGLTWARFGTGGFSSYYVAPAPSNSEYVYAGDWYSLRFRDPALGDWRQPTTAPAHDIRSVAVDAANPLVAYAGVLHPGTTGAVGGLYRTTDGGRNWARLPGVLDSFSIPAVVAHPTTPGVVWAATAEGLVYRSADYGASWTPLEKYGTIADLVNLHVKAPNSTVQYTATEGYGIQKSTDGGKTFVPVVDGLGNLDVRALAFDPLTPSTLYAGTAGGIFKSTNAGGTWSPTALTVGEITDLVTDNEGAARRIWGTVKGQGVAYSADGGVTFNVYSSGLASLELTSLHLETVGSARRIWGTTRGGDGVVYSDDLGQTWLSAAGAGLSDRDVNDFTIETGVARRIWGTARRIWGTTDSGVFYSDNNGLSWSELSLGLPSGVPVSSVSIDPKTNEVLVSLFSDRDGGVYRGANLNGVWRSFNEGLETLKVRRVTNDGGRTIDTTTTATTFYAATAGDGAYANEIRNTSAPAPSITTTTLPAGRVRVPYSVALGASGGAAPLAWSVPEGYLPPGLVLDPSSGVVSGVPGQLGTFGFSVQVADALARLDRKAFSIVVSDPRPAATAPDVTITEGNTGTKDLVFTVSLSFPADATVTVSYTTADGTATAAAAAADYVARSGVLSFAPGVVSQAVSVPVIGDWVREPGESFFLLLSTPVNALLPRDRIRATIQDDDTRPNDWNGDGRSDLLWSHTVSGSLHAWMLEGTTAKAYSYLTPARPSDRYWQIRALADFDGDGWTDVLWQHQQSGELYVWFLEGTARKSGVYLTPRSVADRNWVVRGAGDFDRDGHPDLLWYHQATGALSVWLMTGTTMKQSVSLSPGATADTRWQVRALADFDGDGQVDLLWHHERSGELSLWKMNGTTRAAVWPLNPSSMPDVRWKIASVLDFDGDGKPDILWHHQRTGDLAVWYLDGAVRVRQEALSPPRQDPYWRLAPRWDPPAPTVVRRTRTK